MAQERWQAQRKSHGGDGSSHSVQTLMDMKDQGHGRSGGKMMTEMMAAADLGIGITTVQYSTAIQR